MSRKLIKKSKIITIKQIAGKAGVSFSTVSKALKNNPLISKGTRKRIFKIAKDLNYYPNLLASSLRNKKTRAIGMILNDLTNPLYYETIRAIEKVLNKLNYTIILNDSNYDLETERKNIISMLSRQVDGLIISPINDSSENIRLIIENDLKSVFIDVIPRFKNINYVYVNHKTAAYKSTEFLIKNGHKKILLLGGPPHLSSRNPYIEGHFESLEKNGIRPDKSLIINSELTIEEGFKTFSQIYKNKSFKNRFSAIICISDLLAIGIYKASSELGLNIPENFSIIGYDNIFVTPFLNPSLTTIHAQKIRVGNYSIEILLDQITNKITDYSKIILEPFLIERNSVKEINLI